MKNTHSDEVARLYDLASLAYFTLDEKGIIRQCNQAAARLLGYDHNRAIGHGLPRFVRQSDQPAFFAFLEQLLAGQGPPPCRVGLHHPDGPVRHLRLEGRRLETEAGPVQCLLAAVDLTGQLEAENALREEAVLLGELEEVARTGHYEADLATMTFRFSDGMYRLFGQAPQSFSPTLGFIDSRSHPDDVPLVKAILDRAVADGKPYHYTRRIYRPDGALRLLEARGKVITDAQGKAVKLIGLVQDITERQRAEQELAASKNLVQTVFDVSLNPIAYHKAMRDASGKIVDFEFELENQAARQYAVEDRTGRRYSEAYPGVKDTLVFQKYCQVVETGNKLDTEVQLTLKGNQHWFHLMGVKLGDGLVATAVDVTARKKAEQELMETKDLLQTVFDTAPNSITAYRPVYRENQLDDFQIVLVNAFTEKTAGVNPAGMLLTQTFPTAKQNGFFDKLRQVTEHRQGQDFELWYEGEGMQHWFRMIAVPMEGMVLVTTEDITGRKKAQEEILRLKDEIAQKATDKYQLIFNSIDEGFCVLELLYDEGGKAVDYRFAEVNPTFERQTGLQHVTGKTFRTLFTTEPQWMDTYDKVVQTGQAAHFEEYHQGTGRSYQVQASRIGNSTSLAIVFQDITQRKEREAHQTFLLKFSDALRAEPDADAVANRTMQMLIEQMGLDRSYIFSWNLQDDVGYVIHQVGNDRAPALSPVIRPSGFPASVRVSAEGTLVIDDIFERPNLPDSDRVNIAGLGMRALVSATLRKWDHPLWSIVAVSAEPRHWTQSEITLVEEVAERTWAAMERAKAEEALRRSEEKYRTLFETMAQGYCEIELVRDDTGRAIDHRYLELNPAFERLLGVPVAHARGRTVTELFPGVVEDIWNETHDRVVRTRRPERMEHRFAQMDRWFEMFTYPTHGDRLVVLYEDVTDRKRREANLAFLASLMSDFAPLGTIEEIMQLAAGRFFEHFHLSHCSFIEIDQEADECIMLYNSHAAGSPALTGTYKLLDFHTEAENRLLASGRPMIVNDVDDGTRSAGQVAAFEAVGIRALVNTPYLNNGRWVFNLAVARSEPRVWQPDEIELLQEVSARVWLRMERARTEEALRKSEAKYRTLFETMDEGFVLVEMIYGENGRPADARYLEGNPTASRMTGVPDYNRRLWSEVMPGAETYWLEIYDRVARTGVAEHMERYAEPLSRWYGFHVSRVADTEGEHPAAPRVAVVFQDITERKRAEEALAADLSGMQRLYELHRKLATETDLKVAIKEIIALSCDLLGTTRGCVQLISEDRDRLEMFAYQGYTDQNLFIRHFLHDGSQPACGAAQRDRTRLVIEDVEHFAPLQGTTDREVALSENIRATQYTPMITRKGELVGVLSNQFPNRHRPSDQELQLIDLLAWTAADFVERHQAYNALKESEERLQKALSIQTVGVLYFDLEGVIHDANTAFCRMSGYLRQELQAGKVRWEEATPPEFMEASLRAVEELRLEGESTPYEKQYIRPDGSRWWGLFAGKRLSENEIVEFVVDITERKNYEAQLQDFNAVLEQQVALRTRQLQESRDLLQSIFDTSLIGMAVLEAVRDERGVIADFRIKFANKELERETGRMDLVGKRYAQEFPGIKTVGLFDLMLQAVETGKPQGKEYYYPHEGFHKWYSCQFVKLNDGLVATNLDITERKRAEAELLKNYHILQQSEEIASLGSWEYDRGSGNFFWSAGMYRLFGMPQGRPVTPEIYLDYALDEDRPVAEKVVHCLKSSPQPLEETLRIQVEGKAVTLKLKAVVQPERPGQAPKMLGVDMDISQIKRLEAENLKIRLEQQQALLNAIMEAQEEERRRISESLHNGVGQLLYATKLHLPRVDADGPPAGNGEAARSLRKVEELLTEAILETRRVSHELVPVLLKDFGLQKAIEEFCGRFAGTGLSLDCHCFRERLPQPLETAVYRIGQELVNNIVKHAGATRALLEVSKDQDFVYIEARDNGKGMDQGSLEGYRPGKGIGMRTIGDRLALLGGTLEVESTPGKGTLIAISIPLR